MLVLWHFPISHFNEKVRWALDWKGLPHVRRALGPDYLFRALWATGQPRLPILFIDGKPVADSTRIIERLERAYPEPALYPRAADDRARALALEEWLDEQLGHAVRTAIVGPLLDHDPQAAVDVLTLGMPPSAARILAPVVRVFRLYYRARHRIDASSIAAAPDQVRAGLDRIAAEIGPSGYLAGDRFSVADLAAASMLSPFVQAPEMQYRLGTPPAALAVYRTALADHPAMRWAADVYRRHRGRSAEVPGSASVPGRVPART